MNIFALEGIYSRYRPLFDSTKEAYDNDPAVQAAVKKAVKDLQSNPAIIANPQVQQAIATLPNILAELRPAMAAPAPKRGMQAEGNEDAYDAGSDNVSI